MQKIFNTIVDLNANGIDTYQHNGSTWLIFTETKQWVIEYTEDRTLWYNYSFFNNLSGYISMEDPNEIKEYVKNWFESRFLSKPKVDETFDNSSDILHQVEDTIQNGVKETLNTAYMPQEMVEETIENGVKETKLGAPDNRDYFIDNAIQNGVKHVEEGDWLDQDERIDDIIEGGVKYCCGTSGNAKKDTIQDVFENGIKDVQSETHHRRREIVQTIKDGVKEVHEDVYPNTGRVDGVIKNGVIKINPMDEWVNSYNIVSKVIINGVKEIKTPGDGDIESTMDFMNENNTLDVQKLLDDVIENGVKEMQPLPAQDGNRDWGLYYQRQQDRTKPHTEYVKDVIREGKMIHE